MFKTFANMWSRVSAVVIITTLVAAASAHAATVTSASYLVTTLRTSTAANHSLLFTTPTGASEGSTVIISFSSDFNISSLTEDDVDVSDDGVQLTTAATCAGSEKISVAIGSAITLTVCAGDGGAIAAGSVVSIKIGTNATNSGIGTQQIVNPAAAGTYFVSLSGSFGDSGSIALPISASADAISVTATIPISGGGGGGGGETPPVPPADTTAPIISSVVVSQITGSSALISWTTNESATSKLEYGITNGLELSPLNNASLTSSHGLLLTGLLEGKTYSFRVKSTDAASNEGSSSIQTFATLDVSVPIISNLTSSEITKSAAHISWTTNENASSVLEYGLTTNYGSTHTDAILKISHGFTVTGLLSGATYHFRVKSTDASGNQVISGDKTVITLVNLPPSNVSNFSTLSGDKKVTLNWKNPLEDDFAGVRILSCASNYPSSPFDATCTVLLNDSLSTAFVHTSVDNGKVYYYGVFAKDFASQFASGALALGNPSATEIELPSPDPDPIVGEPISPETPIVTPPPATGSSESCGDGVCAASESAFVCPSDCKVAEIPKGMGSSAITLSFSDITFRVARGLIQLSGAKYFDVLPATSLLITVPAQLLGENVHQVTLLVGSEKFLMRPVRKSDLLTRSDWSSPQYSIASVVADPVLFYQADVIAPQAVSLVPVTIFIEDKNGQLSNVSSFLRVIAPGQTVKEIDGEEAVVSGVRVTLSRVNGGNSIVWDGSPSGQFNPISSDQNGFFSWYVPNGVYSLQADADGYEQTSSGSFIVSNSIVNKRIVMVPLKEEIKPTEPTNDVGTPTPSTIETITKTVNAFQSSAIVKAISSSEPVKVILESIQALQENPTAQAAAQISLPTLAVSAGTSVVILTVAFDFIPFLQYIFSAPVLFFSRRKRKGFGVVYNAVSKEPIDLAVIRLFEVKSDGTRGKLVRSRVTDKGGRFFLLVSPGKYLLSVTKLGFLFPSDFLKDKKVDVQFVDIYHGETVEVTDLDVVLTPNIPLDPSQTDKFNQPKQIIWRARLRTIQNSIALLGVIASGIFAIIRPNMLAVVMIFVQLGLYFIVRRIAKPRKPKSWGIVSDKETKRPLANVIARIFEPTYNKLLDTQVTDSKGRYAFLLGPSAYFAVFEKPGYTPTQVNPIDYRQAKESQDFSNDIILHPKQDFPAQPL